MTATAMRPCERICRTCNKPLHYNRYRRRQRKTPHGIVWHFDPDCRACQQTARDKEKNTDRALAIIHRRASDRAAMIGQSRDFFWEQLCWKTLVPVMRAMMTDEGRCICCGHRFISESDIQIDHVFPPRNDHDFAREHARNLRLMCRSCNGTKYNRDPETWLDDMEDARVSNAVSRERNDDGDPIAPEPHYAPLPLFD